ncbi:MAG: transglycosylase SLT domain-containing protein [Acetobacteraceae bacterium]|nr:transglycosylase SLT domain-containing protein [Acetobacteraceae bacterium]
MRLPGLAACLLFAISATARAEPDAGSGNADRACLQAAAVAEKTRQTPPGLLATIAKVESGRPESGSGLRPWPWTIDADGQSLFFPSKDAAVAWARAALARGVGYIDVGCMQVDLPMHPDAFRSLEDAFDPEANADYAAQFLRALRDGPAGGNWFTAIGLYHSRTPEFAAAYREAVAAVGAGRPTPAVGAGSTRLQFLRVALTGGGSARINVGRQPSRIKRRLSACQVARVLGPYLRSPSASCANGRPS